MIIYFCVCVCVEYENFLFRFAISMTFVAQFVDLVYDFSLASRWADYQHRFYALFFVYFQFENLLINYLRMKILFYTPKQFYWMQNKVCFFQRLFLAWIVKHSRITGISKTGRKRCIIRILFIVLEKREERNSEWEISFLSFFFFGSKMHRR